VVAAAVLFVATGAIRYLSLTGFSNDHYQHLAGAQQMRFGEWPTRDFVDPGAAVDVRGVRSGAMDLWTHALCRSHAHRRGIRDRRGRCGYRGT
jgi:hypothetical protein